MESLKFMTGLPVFYIKGEIAAEQNFLKISVPNTVLGFIPFGSDRFNIPIAQISSVASSFQFNIRTFIASFLPLFFSFLCFKSGLGNIVPALLFLALGLILLINSFVTGLQIDSTSGSAYYVPFLVFEKSKAYAAEQMIGQIIAARLDDTNVRQATEASTQAIVDAINSK